jgi:hypothetical protein
LPAARARVGTGPVEAFEPDLLAVDQVLRATKSTATAPPGLHQAIMRGIRSEERSRARRPRAFALRWALVGLSGLLVVAGLVLRGGKGSGASGRQALSAATQVLNLGSEMQTEAPAAALAPLAGEWESVNRDVGNAARFLLASLP